MRVLVTGAAGQLGWDVMNQLKRLGIEHRGVDIQDFVLTDGDDVMRAVTAYAPTAIVHCAAYTNVDRAESEPEICAAVNGMGTLFPLFRLSSMDAFEGQREYIRKMLDVWREFAPIQLMGDFYPLTEAHRSAEKWTVFQFDCPEQEKGAFQVLRNSRAREDFVTVRPSAFREEAMYTLRDGESGETRTVSGREVLERGITFSQPLSSGSIWFYSAMV